MAGCALGCYLPPADWLSGVLQLVMQIHFGMSGAFRLMAKDNLCCSHLKKLCLKLQTQTLFQQDLNPRWTDQTLNSLYQH